MYIATKADTVFTRGQGISSCVCSIKSECFFNEMFGTFSHVYSVKIVLFFLQEAEKISDMFDATKAVLFCFLLVFRVFPAVFAATKVGNFNKRLGHFQPCL